MIWRTLTPGLVLAVLAGPAAAQIPFRGSEVFRFAFHQKTVTPLSQPFQALQEPDSTIIVLLGDTNRLPDPINGAVLRDFVFRGGAVLIATDTAAPPMVRARPNWADSFGILITGWDLIADPPNCYEGAPEKPFVVPRARVDPASPSPFDLFEGLGDGPAGRVATYRPSEMSVQPRTGFRTKNLAGYPEGTRRRADDGGLDQRMNYFALSLQPEGRNNQVGAGRVLVIANQGVFFNGMMGFRPKGESYVLDNGNWEFANRTIDWLQGGFGERRRTKCLFIENNDVKKEFAVELPRPPVPDLPPDVLANILLNHSNGVINELQEKNFFNRALEGFFGFPRIVRAFLIAVTALFLFYGLRWLARGHRKAEPAAAASPAQQAALLPRGGVLRQRTAAQIEVGNLSEAAGRRVRDRFDVLGARPGPGGGMPPVLIAIDVPDAPLLRQTVRGLWEIGYGETPVNVPPTEWDRVNGLLERVTARAARGDWSFGQDVA